MSKKKSSHNDPLKNFLTSEIYKIFNQHPNKTFNHKQLARQMQPAFANFIRKIETRHLSNLGLSLSAAPDKLNADNCSTATRSSKNCANS